MMDCWKIARHFAARSGSSGGGSEVTVTEGLREDGIWQGM